MLQPFCMLSCNLVFSTHYMLLRMSGQRVLILLSMHGSRKKENCIVKVGYFKRWRCYKCCMSIKITKVLMYQQSNKSQRLLRSMYEQARQNSNIHRVYGKCHNNRMFLSIHEFEKKTIVRVHNKRNSFLWGKRSLECKTSIYLVTLLLLLLLLLLE